jgi:very-short-patch-repair endonuclease
MSFPYNKNVLNNAVILRKNATKQEKHLWYDFLSKYPIRFQRQKAIGNYIADFYCSKAKLIVEIDGLQHYTVAAATHEEERNEYLNSLGITIIRFKNSEIDNDFRSVCNKIDYSIKKLISGN